MGPERPSSCSVCSAQEPGRSAGRDSRFPLQYTCELPGENPDWVMAGRLGGEAEDEYGYPAARLDDRFPLLLLSMFAEGFTVWLWKHADGSVPVTEQLEVMVPRSPPPSPSAWELSSPPGPPCTTVCWLIMLSMLNMRGCPWPTPAEVW